MSFRELKEHRRYLEDERKLAAYRAALAEVVAEGDVVLDLGAGTGLLGYLACEAGAKSVIALDRGEILAAARQIAVANGYADRITHVQAMSTETRLDTRADVIVCDQIGGMVYDAGILSFYADARKRLLGPAGRLIPASFTIKLAPVEFDKGRQAVDFWSSRPASIDVESVRRVAANTEWHYKVTPADVERLSQEAVIASFAADHEDPIKGSASFEIRQAGSFDGFLGWFEARLSPSVTITNDPWSPERINRWCNFYPVEFAAEVAPGDRVQVDLDLRPRLQIVSWSTAVHERTGRVRRARQSTFHGSFLSGTTLDSLVVDQPVPLADRADLVRLVLDLIDGKRTRREIVQHLSGRIGNDFASRSHLDNFVRRVARLGTSGSGA